MPEPASFLQAFACLLCCLSLSSAASSFSTSLLPAQSLRKIGADMHALCVAMLPPDGSETMFFA